MDRKGERGPHGRKKVYFFGEERKGGVRDSGLHSFSNLTALPRRGRVEIMNGGEGLESRAKSVDNHRRYFSPTD